MTEQELETIVDEWIAYWKEDDAPPTKYDPETGFSIDTVRDTILDWQIKNEHEQLWRFVVSAYRRDLDDRRFALLAAGELEDLIADFGEIYIDRIEELSRKDPKFRSLLGGVWRSSSKPEVWKRIELVRGESW